MPNWCENTLNVWGNETELAKFKSSSLVLAPPDSVHDFEFTLEGLYPTPKELVDRTSPTQKEEGESEEDYRKTVTRLTEEYGFTNWYEWRINKWGTKWDAAESSIFTDTIEEFGVSFNTAWAPPIEWLKRIAIRFPNLNFILTYLEEGQAFCGKVTIAEGEIKEEDGEIIYFDEYGRQVYYDKDADDWKYSETNETVEDKDFWPIATNPYN